MTGRDAGIRIPTSAWKWLLTTFVAGGAGLGGSRLSSAAPADSAIPAEVKAQVERAVQKLDDVAKEVASLRVDVQATKSKGDGIDKALDNLTIAVRDLATEVHRK